MALMPSTESAATEFSLKTTPPRTPRHLLARPRLGANNEYFRDRPVIVVQAPAGFGKTSLLAQWRREHLARGAAVAWISADDRDDPQRFLHSLVHAVRAGCGRPAFGRFLMEGAISPAGELDAMTAWLAEVAQLSLETFLIVDEAERLPAASADALAYLLHNAPQNLRIVVAGRGGLDAGIGDLVVYGQCVCVEAEMLRFQLDETIALIGNRFGTRVDIDSCARLYELTEGWPLGLQLVLAAMEREPEPRAAIDALSARTGNLRNDFVAELISKLSPEDEAFLTRISVVDLLQPDLCQALTGLDSGPEILARLVRETPIFAAAEGSEWCRLHTLARDVLRARLAQWPAEEQAALHLRAMHWLTEHLMIQEAANHAYAAGQHEIAYELAERCLHDAVKQGQLGVVRDWLELLPEAELESRPRLRLAAAWVLALSERHEEARRQIERILKSPKGAQGDAALQYECALILSAAAYYADEIDRFVELFAPWAQSPPVSETWLLQAHANRLAVCAIMEGDPALARRHQQQAPRSGVSTGFGYVARWGDFTVGQSYLWEGQIHLAEEVLRPALTSAEADLGRRHPLACMLAALLAAVVYEADRLDEAAALLANRLDVLERTGTPETVLLAYRTAACLAAAQGIEHRALDLLEAMHAMGIARHLPRLCIAGLAEQIRMHAGRYRLETCRALVQRIDDIVARESALHGPLWLQSVVLLQKLAHANTAIAAQDWPGALEALTCAGSLADAMKSGRCRIEIMALRAFVLDRQGEDGAALLFEAMNLAQTFNLARIFADAPPSLADWADRMVQHRAGEEDAVRVMPAPTRKMRMPIERAAVHPHAVPSMVLTPKEREVLELLARNLTNKEIALAMTVGEETVKWHLKNLFGKLDAGTRKHAVRRALLLGLLEGAG